MGRGCGMNACSNIGVLDESECAACLEAKCQGCVHACIPDDAPDPTPCHECICGNNFESEVVA